MKSTPEFDDRGPNLGAPIRPGSKPDPAPQRASEFEKDDWLPDGIRKHIRPTADEQCED